jgi:hypothetical protein
MVLAGGGVARSVCSASRPTAVETPARNHSTCPGGRFAGRRTSCTGSRRRSPGSRRSFGNVVRALGIHANMVRTFPGRRACVPGCSRCRPQRGGHASSSACTADGFEPQPRSCRRPGTSRPPRHELSYRRSRPASPRWVRSDARPAAGRRYRGAFGFLLGGRASNQQLARLAVKNPADDAQIIQTHRDRPPGPQV